MAGRFFSIPYTRDETQDSDENGLIAAKNSIGRRQALFRGDIMKNEPPA